jgi:hypothetical protein
MADIYKAYQFLNQSLGLGLTETQMSRAEMMLKLQIAQERGFVLNRKDAGKFGLHVFFQPKAGVTVAAAAAKPSAKAKAKAASSATLPAPAKKRAPSK